MSESWAERVGTDWKDFDFTRFERSIEIEGRKINYVDLGDPGKPVLLYVHGLMGTWRNWIFNLLPFVDRYRVIALDLPGFGRSEMPDGEFTVERYAWTLKEFLTELGVEKATFVGNSMGGQIGFLFAKRFPELLDKLFLVDPAGFSTASRRLRKAWPIAVLLNLLLVLVAPLRGLIARSKLLASMFTKIVLLRPAQLGSELILMLLDGIAKPGFLPAVATITESPVRSMTDPLGVETVIIWGRDDWLIPMSDAFRYAKLIPSAKVELMDDVGHIPMFETPERFNALLAQYV